MRTAIVTGVSGQDGSYMAELLLEKGYRVVGTVRDLQAITPRRNAHVLGQIEIREMDLLSDTSVQDLIRDCRPDEIYNFAARASNLQLFENPVLTGEVNGIAVLRLLEAVRLAEREIRVCQASSSEIFGLTTHSPQSETTPFSPRNPYGIAKLFAHLAVGNYRQKHGMFACSAILYNHESPRRGSEFVTRKVTSGVASIRAGQLQSLRLGDLEAKRDWGYAPDYMQAMWKMLQMPSAGDYVLATGSTHSVRELCEIAFGHVGLKYTDHVVFDQGAMRPKEQTQLVGDATRAREVLGWKPSASFSEIICMMVDEDMRSAGDGGAEN